jgi:hypothetical protein
MKGQIYGNRGGKQNMEENEVKKNINPHSLVQSNNLSILRHSKSFNEKLIMKISIEQIKELEIAITALMVNRKDLETLKIKDILHDIVCYCKKTSFEERMKFAKRIINGEVTHIKIKFLSIAQLKARKLFQFLWLKNELINNSKYKEKHNDRNKKWAQKQRDENTEQLKQINLNSCLRRANYKLVAASIKPIRCKIDKCICNRLPQRSNNHQVNGCQKTAQYTLFDGFCIPNEHRYILMIKNKS